MTFPAALRGTWRETAGPAPTAAQCAGSENGNIGKVIAVRDTRFANFEEGGRLIEVKERTDGRLRGVFDTTYADTPTRGEFTFAVDPVAKTLTVTDAAGGPNSRRVYKRCPA